MYIRTDTMGQDKKIPVPSILNRQTVPVRSKKRDRITHTQMP
jgi:hypothetical protein